MEEKKRKFYVKMRIIDENQVRIQNFIWRM
jgi:hypothetical protein